MPSASWEGQARLVRNLSAMAAIIAVVVALAAPAGFLWLTYRAETREATVAARLHAAFVTQVASTSEDWQRDAPSLIEADLTPSDLPEVRTIGAMSGHEIARSNAPLAAPTLSGTAVIVGRQGPIGQVVVTRSLRPV